MWNRLRTLISITLYPGGASIASCPGNPRQRYQRRRVSFPDSAPPPAEPQLASLARIPPFYLRSTSVLPPASLRVRLGGGTEGGRRGNGGTTEVSAGRLGHWTEAALAGDDIYCQRNTRRAMAKETAHQISRIIT